MLNRAPRVVVVGGSLGGLFHAIALRSLGCEVEVFEKSAGLLNDRGAGIVLQGEVVEFFERYGSARSKRSASRSTPAATSHADGSTLQEGPMPQAMTSWDTLYRKLHAAFPDGHYHTGVRLVGFEAGGDGVTARFEGGREEVCDLLVGRTAPVDGPAATLPEVRSEYAGYVAWRGVVPEDRAPDLAAEFAGRFTFFQAPHTHILCYLIPGPDGSMEPGLRRINWVWYLNAAPGVELDRVLTDRDGRRREFSVPQGFVAPGMVDWLNGQARRILPPLFSGWSGRRPGRSSRRSTTSPCRTWRSGGSA